MMSELGLDTGRGFIGSDTSKLVADLKHVNTIMFSCSFFAICTLFSSACCFHLRLSQCRSEQPPSIASLRAA
eukprot:1161374-Amphidinium_carterae.2